MRTRQELEEGSIPNPVHQHSTPTRTDPCHQSLIQHSLQPHPGPQDLELNSSSTTSAPTHWESFPFINSTMKTSTTLMAACAVLYSVFCPVVAGPLPEIHAEGRQFNSRFAPVARPVFPRSYWDNVTSTTTTPGPTAYKRSYPAGPTASAYVFHDKHFAKEV